MPKLCGKFFKKIYRYQGAAAACLPMAGSEALETISTFEVKPLFPMAVSKSALRMGRIIGQDKGVTREVEEIMSTVKV